MKTNAYLSEVLVLNPWMGLCATRGDIYAEAKAVNGEFSAGCTVRNLRPAPAGAAPISSADVRAYFALAA